MYVIPIQALRDLENPWRLLLLPPFKGEHFETSVDKANQHVVNQLDK
jgi:hypothetical protein